MVASSRLGDNEQKGGVCCAHRIFVPSRWCCYGMLWVGAALAIATISVCDFVRISDQADDDFFSLASSTAGYSATAGLFCYREEFFGEFVQGRWSQYDVTDDVTVTSDIDPALKAAQAFGVSTAIFILVALILYHVSFFVNLPKPAAKGIWWTIRVLAIAAVVSVSLTFVAYEGDTVECRLKGRECGVGAGAVLAGINAIILIVLTVCLFLSGPPQAPFRCGSCNCSEDNGSARRADEGKAAQTTTTEEVMEDGRRSITTETVDAFGNKKIVKSMASAAL
jgi:hypothetical protein